MSTRALPAHPRITDDPEVCQAYAADVSGLSRTPEAVARPESEQEVSDILRLCSDRGMGVTPQGLRSSTTGASVPARGIALSLERMNRVLEIDPERQIAVAEPGVVTAEFKRRVGEAGLFFPPDPTSEEECTLGGNVACNASGSRTYRYGPTRDYVRALRVVMADGTAIDVRRIGANKNAAGYFGFQNPIDLWIGSEGTLGVVTQVELDLRPHPPGSFGALAFFSDWRQAIRFVMAADASRRRGELEPRCLEFFDRHALEIIRPEAGGLRIADGAGAAIFFEEEVAPEDAAGAMERWHRAIEAAGGLADETVIAQSQAEQSELRRLRHAVPSRMNERGASAVEKGGRRVSTDFAVPLVNLPVVMEDAYRIMEELFDGFTVAYGHVGNGHPHFNLLAEDRWVLEQAEVAARQMARRAIALGGTLAAEHGIGKLKVPFYRELYPDWLYSGMRALKQTLDPKGILSPGNLFP
ncbi:MAG: FAD-binding oxidoreductase [Candidatus Eisenbacteria sp.]|nr:FAD-binding oxidoreductase [Candidatus Eisenbacteria bacterium]